MTSDSLVFKKSNFFALPLLILVFFRVIIPSTTELGWLQSLEFVVNLLLLFVALLSSVMILKQQTRFWLLGYSGSIFLWIAISNYLSDGTFLQSVSESSIYLIPILIVVNLLEMSVNNPAIEKYLVYIFTVSLLLFFIPLFTSENFTHGGVERLPLYYGTLHDNGYVASITALFGIYYYKYFKWPFLGGIIIVFSFYLMYGYAVRTAHLMFIMAIIGVYLYKIPIRIRNVLIFKVGLFSVMGLIVFYAIRQDAYSLTSSISSGRTEMWIEQFNRFFNADFIYLIFGFGVNGDMIHSNIWAWEAKGAHSTLISFFIRYGIFGFLIIIFFLYRLFKFITFGKKCNKCKWLYLSFVSTLLISNGLMERFVPFLLFLLLFVFIFITKKDTKI